MNVELVTKEDLDNFKEEIIREIRGNRYLKGKEGEPPREWLKSYEVRKLLGISAGTLQNLRLNGSLPYTKVGGLMYYKYGDIRKLMDGFDEH
ncbi:helix-turn-helix domain-containing protein [Flavobacterium dauae]|uniref:helix-turn-helix domain-containing protein n=1 Tax=Flavobacterium dauae TaxID=1563479 RepID=UPI00101B61D7|nr:helix-turn-helix domain-containing protein [Flavobacterium dauae]WLD24355.1 helix-turn-helix domain-containing protein [Flavobacterium dauae]